MTIEFDKIPTQGPVNSSPIGFEGFEKRLEITFLEPSIFNDLTNGLGLRALTRSQIDSILDAARCTIVDKLSNSEFDSYVLSESSLFIYSLKIVIKTCGTTRLLESLRPILQLTTELLQLTVSSVKYSRGSFIFPDHQPAPYRNFSDEVATLNEYFGHMKTAAYVMGDHNRKWHVYSASMEENLKSLITLEMCMTGLNKTKASAFFKKDESSKGEMTKKSFIDEIIPSHVICDFEFEPCGYSMNAIEDLAYSTIHVTPEDGFSYASYEVQGFDPDSIQFEPLVKRVLKCFEPSEFSVAITYSGGGSHTWGVESGADVDGYACDSQVKQELTAGDCLVYKTFTKDRVGSNVGSLKKKKVVLSTNI
jgi:S-adenosylmethionine decarboxylase